MSAPKSLFSTGSTISSNDMMSRAEAQAFLERVVKLSKADAIGVNLNGGYQGNIRFAANRITTSGGVSNSQLAVQSGYGSKHAVVTTSDFSPEGVERAVRQSEALAKLAPEDPDNMPLLPPQKYIDVNAWFVQLQHARQLTRRRPRVISPRRDSSSRAQTSMRSPRTPGCSLTSRART
jgi:hypothetical protein